MLVTSSKSTCMQWVTACCCKHSSVQAAMSCLSMSSKPSYSKEVYVASSTQNSVSSICSWVYWIEDSVSEALAAVVTQWVKTAQYLH